MTPQTLAILSLFALAWPGLAQSPADVKTAFGAKGDGTTNDTPAFNRALASGAGELRLPPGTYLLGPETLVFPPNLTVAGAGNATVIKAAKGTALLFKLAAGDTLKDFRLDGSLAAKGEIPDPPLILLANANGIRLERLAVENADRVCVGLDHANEVVVGSCVFNQVGLAVNVIFSSHFRFEANRITTARIHGLQFWGNWRWESKQCQDIIITGNYVKDGGAGALWGTGATGVIVSNNVVDGATDVGIDLEWCENSAITGNFVRNCKNGGISLFYACRNIAITGNSIVNDGEYPVAPADVKAGWWVRSGIWLTFPNREEYKNDYGHRDITIVGNTITCAPGQRRAIWIGGESKNVVINANAIAGGGVWYGGEHKVNPMILSELPANTVVPAGGQGK